MSSSLLYTIDDQDLNAEYKARQSTKQKRYNIRRMILSCLPSREVEKEGYLPFWTEENDSTAEDEFN